MIFRKYLPLFVVTLILLAPSPSRSRPALPTATLPNPVLAFMSVESIKVKGKSVMRYNYSVTNADAYPAEMFAPAPDLPPCGTNSKASRTWVDLFDSSGKRLNSFCALAKPSDLNGLWFELDPETVPASYVYIELTDRQTNTKYKSNLAETTL